MAEHGRRTILKYTGLAMAGGVLSTGVAAGDIGEISSVDDRPRSTLEEADGWSSLGGNPGNNATVSAAGPEPPATVAWEYERSGPTAVVDGTVYLTTDGEVHALDADDGSLEWKTGGIGATGTPAVTAEAVFVGGERLTRIDIDDGKPCCQTGLEYEDAISSPVVVSGLVFVVADGILYAVDADSGIVQWQFEPSTGSLFEQPVAVADEAVFAVSESELFALELEDGRKRWTVDDPVGDDEYSRFSAPNARQISNPVATDDVVAVGSVDTGSESMWPLGHTTLYDTETGEERVQSERAPFEPGPITDDRFYGIDSHNVTGYDRETGDEVWDTAVNTYRVPSVVVDGETIYAGLTIDGETYGRDEIPETVDGVYAFDAETGEVEWAVGTNGIPEIAVTGGTIYASAETLVAIRAENDERDEDETEADGEDTESAEADEEADATDAETEGDGNGRNGEPGSDDGTETGTDGANESETDGTEPENESHDDGDDGPATGSGEIAEDDGDDTDDGTPGFTAVAGIGGGALTLEWLRRRAVDDEPAA